jgi:hypothetical protein
VGHSRGAALPALPSPDAFRGFGVRGMAPAGIPGKMCYRRITGGSWGWIAGSAPLDDQVDERLGRGVGVLDPMRRVGAATAAVARDEVGRFIAHGDADGAGGDVHMLDRARSMGRGCP